MRTKYYNTGKYKKSKYMNFKYHFADLNPNKNKILVTNGMFNYNKPKVRWRRWHRLNSFERHNEMLKFVKELAKK